MTVFILIGIIISLSGSAAAQQADIVVATDGSGDYTSIQNAVSNAADGDHVKVKSGTYEENIYITTNITIFAPDGAIISNGSTVDAYSGISWRSPSAPKIVGFTFTDWTSAINTGGPDARGDWEVRNSTIIGGSCAVCAAGVEGDWTLDNVTIRDADTPVSAYDNSGNWVIRNSKFEKSGEFLGYEASGDWKVQNTVIHDATDNAINVGNTSGNWMINNTTIRNSSSDAIIGENSGGNWIIHNTTIQGAEDVGIEVDESNGNWLIRNTIVSGLGDEGIDMADSSGEMRITGTVIQDTGEGEYKNAIRIEETTGDWTVENSIIENISGEGIDVYKQVESSQATIRNVTVTNTQNHGVNFYKSNGDWKIIDSDISNSGRSGVEASNSTSDWNITNTSIKTAEDSLVAARHAAGTWQVHNSKLVEANVGIKANDAVKGNVSLNYWDASDGPSGKFNGSGSAAIGNVTVRPYYEDAGLTTLRDELGKDGDNPLEEYRNDNGEVDDTGLLEAIADWRDDNLEDTQLLELIAEWRDGG